MFLSLDQIIAPDVRLALYSPLVGDVGADMRGESSPVG